jgi:hypothetical protein
VGLEIGEENVRGCLPWLSAARSADVPVVALLSVASCPADVYAAERHRERAETLETVVREAGAVWTLTSPLEISQLLEIAVRRGQSATSTLTFAHSLSDDIWRSLPWHSPRTPLRLTAVE